MAWFLQEVTVLRINAHETIGIMNEFRIKAPFSGGRFIIFKQELTISSKRWNPYLSELFRISCKSKFFHIFIKESFENYPTKS